VWLSVLRTGKYWFKFVTNSELLMNRRVGASGGYMWYWLTQFSAGKFVFCRCDPWECRPFFIYIYIYTSLIKWPSFCREMYRNHILLVNSWSMGVIPRSTGSCYVELLKHLASYMWGDRQHTVLCTGFQMLTGPHGITIQKVCLSAGRTELEAQFNMRSGRQEWWMPVVVLYLTVCCNYHI
jgi:hypothetical protein